MAINKLVPLQVTMMDFCMEVGIEHNKYRPLLLRWGKKAYGYMKDCGAAVKRYVKVLEFKDCAVELPENATSIELIVWGDQGCDCDALVNYTTQKCDVLNQKLFIGLNNGSTDQVNPAMYDFQIQNNQMIFPANYDGQKITVMFYGFAEDCGKLLVSEHAIDAIVAYYEWMLSKQTRFKNKEFRLSERSIENSEYRWKRKLAEARANMIQNTSQQERQMVEILKNGDIHMGYVQSFVPITLV
jgi:hypothetical protein